ncbi:MULTISPECIES: hypothetical protein [Aliivibrio]|uniref:hypothetical protein n=1 Tax=Aliivibrio TaxID=511678 RepID=UPI000365A0C6|nr:MULTISPECIES: hypothetical protein [Aliivibrio]MBD1571556.1 hypothetical protein [Aliivibrio sp. S10_S31]OEE17067.1 hypothetical protein A1Q3_16880 [Aliivibrio fischeri ZF-211]
MSAIVFSYSTSEGKSIVQVLNSLGGFISAGGAFAAILTIIHHVYSLERLNVDEEVKSANYVLFILDRQIKYMYLYSKEMQNYATRDTELRALEFPASTFDDSLVNKIETKNTMFLLSTSKPELLEYLDCTQRDYATVAKRIFDRNELYLKKYQEKVCDVYKSNDLVGSDEIINIVGSNVIESLVYATNEMYVLIPKIQSELIQVQKEISDVMKYKHRDRKFISAT